MEQVIKNAVASANMENLYPTDADIELIEKFIGQELSHDQFVSIILNDVLGGDENDKADRK